MTTNPNLVLGFPEGNAEWYFFAGSQYLPKVMNLLNKSILLVVDAALIELYGGLNRFIKDSGNVMPVFEKDYTFKSINCQFVYAVETIKGFFGDRNAIVFDENFIKSKFEGLGQVANLSVKIDTDTGKVYISFLLSTEVL